jgi:hypothetical protein
MHFQLLAPALCFPVQPLHTTQDQLLIIVAQAFGDYV